MHIISNCFKCPKRTMCTKIHTSIIATLCLTALIFYYMYGNEEIKKILNDLEQWRSCKPQHHIMFLKTHKCGSNSISNILFRYGYKHNLLFALPPQEQISPYLGNPAPFQSNMIPKYLLPPSGKVDIFGVHSRLNSKEHSKILHDDTTWITIFREPAAQHESLFSYYNFEKHFKMNITTYSTIGLKALQELSRVNGKYGKNQILFDLGYDDSLSIAEVEKAIEEVEKRFHLVMIMEYMDESLILLKNLLCWSLKDFVVYKVNNRKKDYRNVADPIRERVFTDLNRADVLLYNHFLKKHKQSVIEFGIDKMAAEVEALRNLTAVYYKKCVAKEVAGKKNDRASSFVPKNTSDTDCKFLSYPHRHFIRISIEHQKNILQNL